MSFTWSSDSPRILILGAGCAGLGAAYRLHEIGYKNFHIIERNAYPGGLSSSFIDNSGFTWDLGGHVLFSHYEYFDALMALALGANWLRHVRESYIWIRGRFVPYPFQNNLRSLPPLDQAACIKGLITARRSHNSNPLNFRDWILESFGPGVAELFLFPYNLKVWAHPLEMMSSRWVGERVAPVDLERVVENVLLQRDDPAWGPNNTFRFPARGGTGAIWTAVADLIPPTCFSYNRHVLRVDPFRRKVLTSGGEEHAYDYLISTLPLDVLASMLDIDGISAEAECLKFSTTHVVGLGLNGPLPEALETKNWMYFPETGCPFYRVTVFSNYSPANVPDGSGAWSLMAEVSESPFKPLDETVIVRDVIRGVQATGLVPSGQRIVSNWSRRLRHGYPIPTVDRDVHLESLFAKLEPNGIFSRGRFGAWKYEVGNQDHTCMQGVEIVNHLLFALPEMTLNHPSIVNQAAPVSTGTTPKLSQCLSPPRPANGQALTLRP